MSQAVRNYRSPSLPCFLDFEKIAVKPGGIPEAYGSYGWAKTLWNKWFDEVYPPSRESEDDRILLDRKYLEEESTTQEKELTDSVNPLLLEGETDAFEELESEIHRVTQRIEEGCSSAFNYCRRGAIYRKIGKLKAAMDDLEEVSFKKALIISSTSNSFLPNPSRAAQRVSRPLVHSLSTGFLMEQASNFQTVLSIAYNLQLTCWPSPYIMKREYWYMVDLQVSVSLLASSIPLKN